LSFPSQAIGLNTAIDIHQSFLWILNILKKPTRKYTFRMANRLFAENTCEFLPVSSISRMITIVFKYLDRSQEKDPRGFEKTNDHILANMKVHI
jgi:hypothetical protein